MNKALLNLFATLLFISACSCILFKDQLIEINSCEELFKIDPSIEISYILKNDLNCKGVHFAIGNERNPFKGNFDYNGKKINANLIPPSLTGSVFYESGKLLYFVFKK